MFHHFVKIVLHLLLSVIQWFDALLLNDVLLFLKFLTGALTTATLPVDAPPVDGAVAMEGDVLSTVLPTDTEIDSIALATSLEDIEAAKTILETAYTLSHHLVILLPCLFSIVLDYLLNLLPITTILFCCSVSFR